MNVCLHIRSIANVHMRVCMQTKTLYVDTLCLCIYGWRKKITRVFERVCILERVGITVERQVHIKLYERVGCLYERITVCLYERLYERVGITVERKVHIKLYERVGCLYERITVC